jgi:hypothetical protein
MRGGAFFQLTMRPDWRYKSLTSKEGTKQMTKTAFTDLELHMILQALRVKIKADFAAEQSGEINGMFIQDYVKLRRKVEKMHEACFTD